MENSYFILEKKCKEWLLDVQPYTTKPLCVSVHVSVLYVYRELLGGGTLLRGIELKSKQPVSRICG